MKAIGRVIYSLGKPLIIVNSGDGGFVEAPGDGEASPDAGACIVGLVHGVSPSGKPGENKSASAFADTPYQQKPPVLP